MDIEDSITQLEEAFEGTPWYGPPILESLKGIPTSFWDNKGKEGSHSIAELVIHMIDWKEFVIEKLMKNEKFSIEMNSEQDWKENVSIITEEEKNACITKLSKAQEKLCELLESKPDSWMSEFVPGKEYSNEYMIRGAIQHDIYHLGQINMMFKMLKKDQE